MKNIELKKNTQFDSATVLKSVLEQASVQGMTIAEMRNRMRILDKLETANGKLELEPSDWAYLKQIYSQHSFRIAHKDFLSISEDIEGAT